MYAYLKGTVVEMEEDNLVVEVNGIGYNVKMPSINAGLLPPKGSEIKVYTYTSVREDAIWLYGFLTKDELHLFKQLITVNGIGPKGAQSVLSAMPADELRFAVLSDDVKTISRAPGIGRKTAQKLILELKDKLKLEDAFEKKLAHEQEAAALSGSEALHDGRREAVEALTALGYSNTDALRAVRKVTDIDPEDVEGLLKAALKNL